MTGSPGEGRPSDERAGNERNGNECNGNECNGDERTGNERTGNGRAGDEAAADSRRTLDARDRPDAERLRHTPSADDGRVEDGRDEAGEGAAEMDGEIERRSLGGGHGLRATEFDIARLPPD